MKKHAFFTIVLAAISLITNGQAAPGTVQISENYFADKREVTNMDWREYMYWNKKVYGFNSPEHKATLPDTTFWLKANYPLQVHYLRHPAYAQYPVVGISYDQAMAFCQWRTDRVNEFIYIKETKIEPTPGQPIENLPKVFQYRLPTKEEWEKLAQTEYSKKGKRKFEKKKFAQEEQYNFIDSGTTNEEENGKNKNFVRKTALHYPNAQGIYDICGNVAEMVAEKGIAKGGSWTHLADEVTAEKDFSYTQPSKWLGFRCVCEKVYTK